MPLLLYHPVLKWHIYHTTLSGCHKAYLQQPPPVMVRSRGFGPIANTVQCSLAQEPYDLVTSGFSLCELEDAEARKEHVRRMWDLTRGYLVRTQT